MDYCNDMNENKEEKKTVYLRGIWGWDDWALLPERDPLWGKPGEHLGYRAPNFLQVVSNKLIKYNGKVPAYKGLSYFFVGASTRPFWCLCFSITKKRKNIFFTVTDLAGRVLISLSAGLFNIPKRKRLSPQALEPLFQKIVQCFLQRRVYNAIVKIKIKARYLYTHIVRLFKDNHIAVRLVYDCIPVPHNGIRSRKQRRL